MDRYSRMMEEEIENPEEIIEQEQDEVEEINPNINTKDARYFSETEVAEVATYLRAAMDSSILNTLVFITEDPLDKVKMYLIMYRILNSAKNYVYTIETRAKLIYLLEENKDIFDELKYIQSRLDSKVKWGSHRVTQKLKDVFSDFDKNFKINKLIDIFFIFSEKQTLLSTDKVIGLEMDTPEGRAVYKKIKEIMK